MKDLALSAPEWLARSAVYQVNPRTFSPAGTLRAVTAQLPALAALGFSVLYLCPIFAEDASDDPDFWSDRQRRSQTQNPKNPYRILDYFSIDEEYGTMDELRALIQTAHGLGQRVMLDLVYMHIGPNAPILQAHPEFARQDAQGNIQFSRYRFPYLDFACPGLREYLLSNMTYYIGALDADGFRCDVGDSVPVDFWAEGRRRMRAIKPDAALINEGHQSERLRLAFDSMYCFDWHDRIHEVFADGKPARLIREAWERLHPQLPAGALLLRDTENHDTVTDWPARLERAAGHAGMELVQTLNYLIDGIPMVYCGNELADETTLSMFANRFHPGVYQATDRATAAASAAGQRRQAVMRALNAWKKESDALRLGDTVWLDHSAPDQALCFRRVSPGQAVSFLANASGAPCAVRLEKALPGKPRLQSGCVQTGEAAYALAPYGYLALESIE